METNQTSAEIGKKDEWKWGWGWYILGGIIFTVSRGAYAKYGYYGELLQLLAVVSSLAMSYAIRRNYLKRVKDLTNRSIISGVISFILASVFTAVVSVFVPTQEQRVDRLILSEGDVLEKCAKDFSDEKQKMWMEFVSEPKSEREYRTNLNIVNSSIPVYYHKDSILISVFTRLCSKMKDIYDENRGSGWSLVYSPSDVQGMVDKLGEITRLERLVLLNLSSYYKSVLSKDRKEHEYWKAYEQTQRELSGVQEEYSKLAEKLKMQ